MTDDDELERRRRAAREGLKRMFRDKPEGPHYPAESIPDEIDEDELDKEIEELEAELADELAADDE
jgi:hypothetical protein